MVGLASTCSISCYCYSKHARKFRLNIPEVVKKVPREDGIFSIKGLHASHFPTIPDTAEYSIAYSGFSTTIG